MDDMSVFDFIEQAIFEGVLVIKCPNCDGDIIAEPDTKDIFCEQCKMIVMQNPLGLAPFNVFKRVKSFIP